MENIDSKIDKFLDARLDAFAKTEPKTYWPACGSQLYSYFSDAEAYNILQKIKKIRKDKIPLSKIAKLFYAPTTIRYYLGYNAITGLKIRKKYFKDITQEDIINVIAFFFDLLENMQTGDIFCSDGKNMILNNKELPELVSKVEWNKADDALQKAIAKLIISSLSMAWAINYDCMAGNGLENHGPYDVSKKFGPNSILIIREFFNLKPLELWEHSKEFKYNNIKIYTVYKNLEDIKIDYFSHIISNSVMRERLSYFYILVDGKKIDSLDEINKITEQLLLQANKQIKFVNSLSTEDKIKKGAEISYHAFKEFMEFFGENWKPEGVVEESLKEFGLEFWEKFKVSKTGTSSDKEFLRKLLDPRSDFLGKDES